MVRKAGEPPSAARPVRVVSLDWISTHDARRLAGWDSRTPGQTSGLNPDARPPVPWYLTQEDPVHLSGQVRAEGFRPDRPLGPVPDLDLDQDQQQEPVQDQDQDPVQDQQQDPVQDQQQEQEQDQQNLSGSQESSPQSTTQPDTQAPTTAQDTDQQPRTEQNQDGQPADGQPAPRTPCGPSPTASWTPCTVRTRRCSPRRSCCGTRGSPGSGTATGGFGPRCTTTARYARR